MMFGHPMASNPSEWSPDPLSVRLEPCPFFVADWQVATSLRNAGCGEVTAVRFQRNGEGAAIARFGHPSGAAAALRCGELNLLGQRVFITQHWNQWSGGGHMGNGMGGGMGGGHMGGGMGGGGGGGACRRTGEEGRHTCPM